LKVPTTLELTNLPQPQDPWSKAFATMLNKIWVFSANVINNHISFGDGNHSQSDNVDGKWVTTTTPAVANTDFNVLHNLGRVASGVILMQAKDAATDIYVSPSDPGTSTTQIIMRATAGSVLVVLFVV
jgi:hypothetical protein